MPGDPGGDALERNALAWNTAYKALKTQLARHELSPSSAMFLAALASAVAQDPANKRKAAEALLAAAGRPHGENSAAINTEANTAQTRSRQAQPFEGEANARRGASFPPRTRSDALSYASIGVSGFRVREAFRPMPCLASFW